MATRFYFLCFVAYIRNNKCSLIRSVQCKVTVNIGNSAVIRPFLGNSSANNRVALIINYAPLRLFALLLRQLSINSNSSSNGF